MITCLVLALVTLVLLAPVRSRVLGQGAWRLTLPLLAGAALGWWYLGRVSFAADYWWLWILVPAFGASILASAVFGALNQLSGPPRNRR